MGHGVFAVYNAVIASAASTSGEVDLGRPFAKVYVDITDAAGSVSFQAAPTSGGTYRFLRHAPASGMSAPQTFTVGSALSGSLVEASCLAGHRFVKIVATGAVANGVTLKIYGADF